MSEHLLDPLDSGLKQPSANTDEDTSGAASPRNLTDCLINKGTYNAREAAYALRDVHK